MRLFVYVFLIHEIIYVYIYINFLIISVLSISILCRILLDRLNNNFSRLFLRKMQQHKKRLTLRDETFFWLPSFHFKIFQNFPHRVLGENLPQEIGVFWGKMFHTENNSLGNLLEKHFAIIYRTVIFITHKIN